MQLVRGIAVIRLFSFVCQQASKLLKIQKVEKEHLKVKNILLGDEIGIGT